jgi:hypothetical protein
MFRNFLALQSEHHNLQSTKDTIVATKELKSAIRSEHHPFIS